MAKSMAQFKGRGAAERRKAKVDKVVELRQYSNEWRQNLEPYWKRDEEDIEGYVDKSSAKKFPYKSRFRMPTAMWMGNAWVDNQVPIILDEDHPIELWGREGVSREVLFTRQALLDYQLYQSGFGWKYEDHTREAVNGGTAIWQVVRHTGTRKMMVKDIVTDPETAEIKAVGWKEDNVPYPYYGVGIEPVSKWDIWPDPSASNMEECPWLVKRVLMTKRDIELRWPETKKIPDKRTREGAKDELSWENFAAAPRGTDYRSEYDTYSGLNHESAGGVPKDKQNYEIHILWDTYEDEIIVTLGDMYLLDYRPLEMGDKRLPFVMSRYLTWNKYFFGKSLPHVIHSVSKACEVIFNMHIDVTQLAAHPQYIVSSLARANIAGLRRGEPGAIVEVVGDPNMVQQLQKNFPTQVATMDEVQFLFNIAESVSNVSNYAIGQAGASGVNRTATGVVTLTQRSQSGFLQHAKRDSAMCLEPLGNKINDAIDVMYNKPQVMSIVGLKGEHYDRRWTVNEMAADVKTRPKRLRDHSEKAMSAQMYIQLAQMGLTQDPKINGVELYTRMFEALGERDIPKLVNEPSNLAMLMRQPVDPAQSFAEVIAEQRQLQERGYIKPPVPDEDDNAHIALHGQFIQGPKFAALPEQAQEAMWEHMLAHEQFRTQEEQVNAMFQAQQGMGPGAAPGMPPQQLGQATLANAGQAAQAGGAAPTAGAPTINPASAGAVQSNPIRGGVGG
jgi:hypothetical protein